MILNWIFIKRFIKILVNAVVVLVSLQVALLIVLQFPAVQTVLTKSVARHLSNDAINGKLSIGKVYFVFFNKLILSDVSIVSTDRTPLLDSLKLHYNQSDTLVGARKVSVSLDPMELMKLNLQLGTVSVSDGVFNLQDEGYKKTNLDRIFNLAPSTEKDTTKGSFSFKANALKVSNFRFTLNSPDKAQYNEDSIINFSNLRVRNIYVDFSDISLQSDTLRAVINDIRGVDESGFRLKTLTGNLRVCGTEALVSDLFMQDNYSTVDADYFYMRYETSKDFSNFTQKVKLGAKFTGSFLDFHTKPRGIYLKRFTVFCKSCFVNTVAEVADTVVHGNGHIFKNIVSSVIISEIFHTEKISFRQMIYANLYVYIRFSIT